MKQALSKRNVKHGIYRRWFILSSVSTAIRLGRGLAMGSNFFFNCGELLNSAFTIATGLKNSVMP